MPGVLIMAANGVTGSSQRFVMILVTVGLVLIIASIRYINDRRSYDLHADLRSRILSVQDEFSAPLPRKANQSRSSRFVSLSRSSLDGRRLGNQLFDWAAVFYVARLTGLLTFAIRQSNALQFDIGPIRSLKGTFPQRILHGLMGIGQ